MMSRRAEADATDAFHLVELPHLGTGDMADRPAEGDVAPRFCRWCRVELDTTARRDARYCSQRCRQAAHRFHRLAVARRRARRPMRFAYADPPYPGRAHLYKTHPDYAGEVDHRALIDHLVASFPDGWALSTDARSLPFVLSCLSASDTSVAVAAWFRRPRPHATARRPVSAWEPVVYAGGRQLEPSSRALGDGYRYDALICRAGPRTTDPDRVIGAKPAAFAYWVFDLLGALPGDELVDLFPGSGGIGRAWAHYASLAGGADDCPAVASVGERHDASFDVGGDGYR